jgi:hypothetical protein
MSIELRHVPVTNWNAFKVHLGPVFALQGRTLSRSKVRLLHLGQCLKPFRQIKREGRLDRTRSALVELLSLGYWTVIDVVPEDFV